MSKITKEIKFGNHSLILETGEVARQADGSVFASICGTQILATVVVKKDYIENNDFFPLTVNYQERMYAVGKIPGGFNRREGRPSENEILISRLIDRSLRPLFPDNFRKEIQIVITVMSLNPEIPADIIAIIAAAAALAISGIPFNGPLGAARVGYRDGIYLLNPSHKDLQDSALDLVVAGTAEAIVMVESEAKELSEEVTLGAILFGHEMVQSTVRAINEMTAEITKPAIIWTTSAEDTMLKNLLHNRLVDVAQPLIMDAYKIKNKSQRYARLAAINSQVISQLIAENHELKSDMIANAIAALQATIVRKGILNGEARIDGRDHKTVRPIVIRPHFLERAHGSALFSRGETQAIVAATLGSERDAQILDGISGEAKSRFMLHYNFPPYSVGEVGMIGTPKRREIGHGRLAQRSLIPVLPSLKEFPYILRIVSEITESNGSSSMATVCGASLALMDAGVPIKAPVAGVAMGLIKEGEKFVVLTDILGDEDHLGDMDFKVAGTINGITALQMDIKITGITKNILECALNQALIGRKHILEIMYNATSNHRAELSLHAPRIVTMKIAEDKIRTIIGKGGATIKSLSENTGVTIDIDDTGVIQLFSPNSAALENAKAQIKALIIEVEVGKTYIGRISRIVEFGAFINLLPGKDGLLHISQICHDRTQKISSVLQEGQEIEVLVSGIDKQGKVKLEWSKKNTTTIEDVHESVAPSIDE